MPYKEIEMRRAANRVAAKRWAQNNKERVSAAARAWQLRNPEKVRENAKRWRQNWTPEQRDLYLGRQRERTFKQRYGLTLADYKDMLVKQGGHCVLCSRTPEQERYGRLNVDHCHETGRVRGLLCTPCNHALGMLGDNVAGLQKAVEYLTCQA